MDLNSLGIFKLMARKMDWLTQRQEVLSQNIANADTPKYKARDLAPFDFRTAVEHTNKLTLERTTDSHIKAEGTAVVRSDYRKREHKDRKAYETAPGGNGVVLEDQMIKMHETASDYQTITNLYRKQVALIKTAIGRTGG